MGSPLLLPVAGEQIPCSLPLEMHGRYRGGNHIRIWEQPHAPARSVVFPDPTEDFRDERTCMGLVGVKWFVSPSVPAVAARRVDRLEFLEIEVGDCLELVDQSRSFEVVRQVVEPGAVFVLQSDQRRYRCCPASGPWREPRRRRGGGWAALLAQPGTASRLPLGRGQRRLVDAMSGILISDCQT